MQPLPSILFVCMGNICRSPAAEIIWTDKLHKTPSIIRPFPRVDSAGTIAYHTGEAPDSRMQIELKEAGYQPFGKSRQIQPADFDRFDLILAMDRENLKEILRIGRNAGKNTAQCHLFLEFAKMEGNIEVPDPYYGGVSGFREVIRLVETASDLILQRFLASGA